MQLGKSAHKQITTKTTSLAAHLVPNRRCRCTHPSLQGQMRKRPSPWFLLCGMNWWPSQGFQLHHSMQYSTVWPVLGSMLRAQQVETVPKNPRPQPRLHTYDPAAQPWCLRLLVFAVHTDGFQQLSPLDPLVSSSTKRTMKMP